MSVFLSPVGGAGAQFFDNNGNPLTGGKLYTYAAGTTTPQATYTSSAGSVFHSNPIVLDAAGRVPGSSEIWLTDSAIYKFVLKTSDDVLLATWDQITGVNSNFVNYTTETEVQTATAGQTVFTLTTMQYNPGSGNLTVYIDGVNQYEGTSYLETDSTTVTFLTGLHVGALVKFTTAVQTTGNATDASVVTYMPAGTGAIASDVQTKLRETLINRNEYATSGDFNAAVAASPDIPNLDGNGNFSVNVTPSGENAQLALKDAVLTVAAGPRDAICYAGAQSVKVFRNFATMGGFRFRGQYSKGRAPTFAMPSNKVATAPADLGGMTAKTNENWYAVFACANDGDATATLKMMPFLRAQSVTGSVIDLSQFKEGMTSLVPQTYAWTANDNLAGCDLLVITENAEFSGRVTQITANTTGSISVDNVGSIAATDTFLPAPPGFDHYVYLGSFYFDTTEVRNIFDSGTLVKTKGIFTLYPDTSTGSFPYPTFTTVDCTGYISPLATAVVFDSSCTLSTASAGAYAEYFGGDASNHIVQTGYVQKVSTNNLTIVFDNIQVPFLYPQTFAYANTGPLTATRTDGQFNITGWFEP